MAFRDSLEQSWREPNGLTVVLWPLSQLYRALFALRSFLYRTGLLKSYRAPVPVIVVGNLTVGGTGKTPLTIFLIETLRRSGYRPGVVSRGYGGNAPQYPLSINAETSVRHSGDEPALIVKRTNVPMVVGPSRADSIRQLLSQADVDVVISDDGLQHLAMDRDIEICLQDSTQPNRNSFLLPAGPYRESLSRLNKIDFVVCHGLPEDSDGEYAMNLVARAPQKVLATETEDGIEFDHQAMVNAVAGIGKPQRFYSTCRQLGLRIKEHSFVDHHPFSPNDIDLEAPVLMTEKDAVKCASFADQRHWFLPVDAKLSADFTNALISMLKRLKPLK